MTDAPRPPDPNRLRDIGHSLGISVLAVVLSGGLLYLVYLWRVWRVATASPHQPDAGDCVLVFGKRLVDGAPDADYRQRLDRAHRLALRQPQRPMILLGGGDGPTEAAVGLATLRALGLPDGIAIRLEDRSLDTLENLRNARTMLAADAGTVLLLSNRYHLARCLSLARGLRIAALPCAAEDRFRLGEQRLRRLLLEAGFLCWLEVGSAWARLIGHRRMVERVS